MRHITRKDGMNETLAKAGRHFLKIMLAQCTPEQQLVFKRMYAKGAIGMPINEVVDKMDSDKISTAMDQCEATLNKKK